jgi:hypothetical protein
VSGQSGGRFWIALKPRKCKSASPGVMNVILVCAFDFFSINVMRSK